MDRCATEKNTRLRRVDHVCIDSVGASSRNHNDQLMPCFLQVLVSILIVEIVQRQIDRLEQLALVGRSYLALKELLLVLEVQRPLIELIESIVLFQVFDVARAVVSPVDERREEIECSLDSAHSKLLVGLRSFVHAYFQVGVLEELHMLRLEKGTHVIQVAALQGLTHVLVLLHFLLELPLVLHLWIEEAGVEDDRHLVGATIVLDAPLKVRLDERDCLLCLHVAIVVELVHV